MIASQPAGGAWTEDAARRAMRLAMVDGVLFALMLGVSETCFIAEAVRIGASALELSLIATLPLWCGGIGSVLVLRGLQRLPRRRPWVVWCALAQVVLLAVLAAAAARGFDSVPVVLAILCLYHAAGQAAGTAWSSWFGDVVPREQRGRYFSRRTRLVHLAAFCSVLIGGAVLQLLEPSEIGADAGGDGFALLFALAAVARLVSAWLLARAPEPRFRGLPAGARPLQWLAAGRGRNAWRLLIGCALFQVGVYLAAPYFVPFMLEECRIGYLGYMVTLGAVVLGKALSLPAWGWLVDRRGSHTAFALALFLSAWVPLPFLWTDELLGLSLAYLWSGLAWGGYEVASFALMLDSSSRRSRPQLFAALGFVNGAGQFGGGLLGAGLVGAGGHALAFATSFFGRLSVALLLPLLIRPMQSRQPQRGRGLALRLIGFRAHGGLVHRPVLDESGESRDEGNG